MSKTLNTIPVRLVEDVANLALIHTKAPRQVALTYMSAQGTDGNYVILSQLGLGAPPCVSGVRHGLKMGGVYTGAVLATNPAQTVRLRMTEVVKFTPGRDRADQALVSPAMCEVRTAAASRLRVPSITVGKTAGRPFPAAIVKNAGFRPKAGRQARVAEQGRSGTLRLHRKTPFGAMQPEAPCLAAASIIPCRA